MSGREIRQGLAPEKDQLGLENKMNKIELQQQIAYIDFLFLKFPFVAVVLA